MLLHLCKGKLATLWLAALHVGHLLGHAQVRQEIIRVGRAELLPILFFLPRKRLVSLAATCQDQLLQDIVAEVLDTSSLASLNLLNQHRLTLFIGEDGVEVR